jgi:predicted deacylase
MAPAPTLTTETQGEAMVTLAPELTARIAATLATYHELKEQAKLYAELAEAENKKIMAVLEAEGLERVEVEGVPCSIVRGTTPTLDKIRFCELGGSLEMLENATMHKPRKPYLLIGKAK